MGMAEKRITHESLLSVSPCHSPGKMPPLLGGYENPTGSLQKEPSLPRGLRQHLPFLPPPSFLDPPRKSAAFNSRLWNIWPRSAPSSGQDFTVYTAPSAPFSLDVPYGRNYELHCLDKETSPEKLSNSPKVTQDSDPGLTGPRPKCFSFSLITSPRMWISRTQGPSSVTRFSNAPPPQGVCEHGEDATRMPLLRMCHILYVPSL